MSVLSIIMPVLDEAAGIAATLAPLQAWRAHGTEIILADGGSRDGTPEAAGPWVDRVVHAPCGRARQMNAGAAAAQGDILLFLHADTVLPPGADELVRAALAGGRHAWGRFDVRLDSERPLLACVGALMNRRSRWTGIATGDQAMFCTRAAFAAAGGFPVQPLMEDIALSQRLKRLSAPAALTAQATTSARRWERHGAWRTILRMWALRAAYFCGADPATLARRYGYRIPEPGAHVAVLARAPLAGRAKTRLIPACGAEAAAAVARACLEQTLRVASEAAPGNVSLWLDGPADERIAALARRFAVTVRPQPEGDLGARMHAVFAALLPRHPEVLLVGTDCPVLNGTHLGQAAGALASHDLVFIPAEDGGYVLIGARRIDRKLFEGIAWSTETVMAQTRAAVQQLRWPAVELEMLWDLDRPADLERALALGLLEIPAYAV
jgi:rSAM/selenodomain-associated transferase 2/rSAM/selenodomain-associated transferase 1